MSCGYAYLGDILTRWTSVLVFVHLQAYGANTGLGTERGTNSYAAVGTRRWQTSPGPSLRSDARTQPASSKCTRGRLVTSLPIECIKLHSNPKQPNPPVNREGLYGRSSVTGGCVRDNGEKPVPCRISHVPHVPGVFNANVNVYQPASL